MPNINAVLNIHIARLAKRVVTATTKKTRKLVTKHRRDLAAIKRQMAMVLKTLAFLERQEKKRASEQPVPKEAEGLRFRADGLKTHRAKLGLSAADFQPADELIAATNAIIKYGGDRAFYKGPLPEGSWPNHAEGDFIRVPQRTQFVNQPGSFYETVFHELAHWAEVRVGWKRDNDRYAQGELIAEMASCFVSQELCIPQGEGLAHHAAYLKSWLEAMQGDTTFIFRASSQASKVADFLLSFVQKQVTEELHA